MLFLFLFQTSAVPWSGLFFGFGVRSGWWPLAVCPRAEPGVEGGFPRAITREDVVFRFSFFFQNFIPSFSSSAL
jgi:hypothetical protein